MKKTYFILVLIFFGLGCGVDKDRSSAQLSSLSQNQTLDSDSNTNSNDSTTNGQPIGSGTGGSNGEPGTGIGTGTGNTGGSGSQNGSTNSSAQDKTCNSKSFDFVSTQKDSNIITLEMATNPMLIQDEILEAQGTLCVSKDGDYEVYINGFDLGIEQPNQSFSVNIKNTINKSGIPSDHQTFQSCFDNIVFKDNNVQANGTQIYLGTYRLTKGYTNVVTLTHFCKIFRSLSYYNRKACKHFHNLDPYEVGGCLTCEKSNDVIFDPTVKYVSNNS